MDAKTSLRRDALRRRAGLTTEQRLAAGRGIELALHDLLRSASRVAAYAAVGSEPPTAHLVAGRSDVLFPVLLPDGDLEWATGILHAGPSGLREPTGPLLGVDAVSTCDLVLVPALAVDRTGTRLGRGGGSYDRALLRAVGRTVALLYDGELVEALPAQSHDVRVRAVVTPSGGLVDVPW